LIIYRDEEGEKLDDGWWSPRGEVADNFKTHPKGKEAIHGPVRRGFLLVVQLSFNFHDEVHFFDLPSVGREELDLSRRLPVDEVVARTLDPPQ